MYNYVVYNNIDIVHITANDNIIIARISIVLLILLQRLLDKYCFDAYK